jgi:hypothetical protein
MTFDDDVARRFAGHDPETAVFYNLYLPPGTRGIYVGAFQEESDLLTQWFLEEQEFILAPGMMFLVVSVDGCPIPDMNDTFGGEGVPTYHMIGYYPSPSPNTVYLTSEIFREPTETPGASTSAAAAAAANPETKL